VPRSERIEDGLKFSALFDDIDWMGRYRVAHALAALSLAALCVMDVHPAAAAIGPRPPVFAPPTFQPGRATPAAKLWLKTYNGPGNDDDCAAALSVSPDGSTVFVTGYSYGSTGHMDYATVAQNASTGAKIWVKRYDGPDHLSDRATAMGVSPDGSTVFVTGYSYGWTGSDDYATVAYRASTGKRLWAKRYNGPGNNYDNAWALRVSPDGSTVFVTGGSDGLAHRSDYATIAYSASTGAELWVMRYDGPAGFYDLGTALDVSPDGSTLFVTGDSGTSTGDDYATVAYDASTGSELWVTRYDGTNQPDGATALRVSPDGSTVFVTGFSDGLTGFPDFASLAYDASTGAQVWVARYDGPGSGSDGATGLAVSPDASTVFVTGESVGSTSSYDYATLAYDASTGAEKWLERYNGPANNFDEATALGVRPNGSAVFVTGLSIGSFNSDFATVAYDASTGGELSVKRYDGPAKGDDQAHALGISPDGFTLFVTGFRTDSTSGFDYATLAYRVA
jgi:hypothetical protein